MYIVGRENYYPLGMFTEHKDKKGEKKKMRKMTLGESLHLKCFDFYVKCTFTYIYKHKDFYDLALYQVP